MATAARSVTLNVVVIALVVWGVSIVLWMTILSGNWNTINCRNSREALQRTINISGHLIPPPAASIHAPSASPSVDPQTPPVTITQTPFAKRLLYYSSQIEPNLSLVSDALENCTLVVQTYKRADILPKFLSHYCTVPVLRKILVVWNDVNETVPGNLMGWTNRCRRQLEFLKFDANKITNRYIPRKEIETDCK